MGEGLLDHLPNANYDANPELMRLGLKLATGAGKTTVMAMRKDGSASNRPWAPWRDKWSPINER